MMNDNYHFVKINQGDNVRDVISKYSLDLSKLSQEQQNIALYFITSINPYIGGDYTSDGGHYAIFRHPTARNHNNSIIIAIPSTDELKEIIKNPIEF